ncbi:MAG: hypothetical protein CSB28_01810 [Desulfobacterales bacterium]|nr:MAG: hypothetical protein CSB28_01810 [Desulfobacterales bacterium]
MEKVCINIILLFCLRIWYLPLFPMDQMILHFFSKKEIPDPPSECHLRGWLRPQPLVSGILLVFRKQTYVL